MSNSSLILDDKIKTFDEKSIERKKKGFKTQIICKDQFGNVLFEKTNTTLAAGSSFVLQKLFNIPEDSSDRITLNSILSINTTGGPTVPLDGPDKLKTVCLFAVGIGGASLTFGDIIPPASRENDLFEMIPIRYVDAANDLTGEDLSTYFMRKVISNKVCYYCKAFETDPILVQKNADGTDFIPSADDNITPTASGDSYITKTAVETYVECSLKISSDDIREWFQAGDGINMSRVNEIALYYGIQATKGAVSPAGYKDYYDVQAFSKLTFDSEPLSDLSKVLNITYRIYC